ncbi:MAG: glucosidase [Bacteroidota bacterium]
MIEQNRLDDHYARRKNWMKWGPYLSERQWGTVREDYSPHGTAWEYFPHDHARSRQYRWGEDGIAGISDKLCRICFATAMWNGQDAIIKERLFGLTGNQGNHAEDVKELYYYLDATPTHSYLKHLYKYPQRVFPYADLVSENRRRPRSAMEYEILDTGVFQDDAYFDVYTEYAKADEEDMLIKITAHNRGQNAAPLTLLPTLWLRNLWSYRLIEEKPSLELKKQTKSYGAVHIKHDLAGEYYCYFEAPKRVLFTENETNMERVFGAVNGSPYVKDTINDAVVSGDFSLFENHTKGTKFTPLYEFDVPAGESVEIRLRLSKEEHKSNPLAKGFNKIFKDRIDEANAFYQEKTMKNCGEDHINIQRQAFAGMIWTKQYYNIDVNTWLDGDKGQPAPPESRKTGRNSDWRTLNNEDILSMPDKWEYPWYAAWDSAFHCIPLAMIDLEFAKKQLLLFLREWYMRPNGQLPAYEWAFGDVNPPVHAWAVMEVYRMEKAKTGKGDTQFLKRAFQKLALNFTWWVNRKDGNNNNIFEGGFLGLDNIGVFDRSAPMPGGGTLQQADSTSWMAMFALNMLDMALEIAPNDFAYEDMAYKFYEHFIYISAALNKLGDGGANAWDEAEGFFYDVLKLPNAQEIPIKVRSLVGLSTLFASLVIKWERIEKLERFYSRIKWFRDYRVQRNKYLVLPELEEGKDILLSAISRDRLERILEPLLDEKEFFSCGGIRSVSKVHEIPYSVNIVGEEFGLQYQPAESQTHIFGGNSNWRGPVWMPMNYLLIESLRILGEFYGDDLKADCPKGSGQYRNLTGVATDIANRLISIFTKDKSGARRLNGSDTIYRDNPHFKDLVLFYEYFDGNDGRGVGASHQTGWTGLIATLIEECGGE